MRELSKEEAALWSRVTATIEPLHRTPATKTTPEAPPLAGPVPPQISRKPKGPAPRPAVIVAASAPAIGSTLDGSWDKKLRAGMMEPDGLFELIVLDLLRACHAI